MLDLDASNKLNEKLLSICDESKQYGYEAFGGKAIPYLGWWWRPVAFDRDDCLFGVVYEGGTRRVGFDESGKDFGQVDYINVAGDRWRVIKRLVIDVARRPCAESLRAVNEAIQALDTRGPDDAWP